jgi:hypothetical protein
LSLAGFAGSDFIIGALFAVSLPGSFEQAAPNAVKTAADIDKIPIFTRSFIIRFLLFVVKKLPLNFGNPQNMHFFDRRRTLCFPALWNCFFCHCCFSSSAADKLNWR